MNGIFTFIFVLLVVWYGTKFFVKYALPWLILHFINKQQDKYRNGFGASDPKKEGEVKIKVDGSDKTKTSDTGFGEYVDFEEVEPDQDTKNE